MFSFRVLQLHLLGGAHTTAPTGTSWRVPGTPGSPGWLVGSYSPVPEARSQLEQIGGMRLRTGQGGHSHLPEEGMVLHAASPQVFAGRFARRLESVGAQLVLETESGIQSQRCDKHKSRVTMRTQDWELRTGNWKLHWDMPTKEAE